MTFDKATTIEQQAQNMADSLGISVWITKARRIKQNPEGPDCVEVRPGARATPTAHGAPADTKPTGDAS
jgi:hypothetical protein